MKLKDEKLSELTNKLGQTFKDKMDNNSRNLESFDRFANDDIDIDFDKIKLQMEKENESQSNKLELKLQETIQLLENKNKTIFDLELQLKDNQSEVRDKQRQYQKDLEVSIEKYNNKIKELQAEIMNFNCRDRFEQVWEKKL